MNSPSPTPTPTPWPPIIEFARAPWFVRLRDIVLTVLAWAFLLRIVQNGISHFIDYLFTHLIYVRSGAQPPPRAQLLGQFSYFGVVALVIMLWLALWSLINRRRLQSFKRVASPAPLPVADHAASFQLAPELVEHWQEMKISIVQFDAQHRIMAVLPSEGNSPVIPHPAPNSAEPEPGPSTAADTGA
jgi:poly-beta-1,6-N-acetyl-D-glucosamine biosynthesis protein PgaD